MFNLLDVDESGELEPEELLIFDRRVVGQSRDAKAKENFQAQINMVGNHIMQFLKSAIGYI